MQKKIVITGLLVIAIALVGSVVWVQSGHQGTPALAVYNVKNLSCGSCVSKIEQALQETPGVGTVKVSVTSAQSQVEFDPRVTSSADIGRVITAAGYPATVRETLSVEEYQQLRHEETRLSSIYVARVGSRLLPRSEFTTELNQRKARGSSVADDNNIRLQVWNDLLQRELLLGAAEENGVIVQDSEVTAQIEKMKAGQPNFEQLVVARYGDLEQYSRQIRNDMIIQRNLELNVAQKVPAETRQQQLQQWYQQLVDKTNVVIFDADLKAVAETSAGGCGGSCCG